jgi:dihydrofolate reductase
MLMRKLVGYTHVSLGGEIGSPDAWAEKYLDEEHTKYASRVLFAADALLLGRRTYEGLSAAYPAMADDPRAANEFIDRMNSIPKFVATRTLHDLSWNASVIDGDVVQRVTELKQQDSGGTILKYGTGPLDALLMTHGLVDEFHLLLTPVAAGRGQHLFEDVDGLPHLRLTDVTRFASGVLALVYAPKTPAAA